MAYTGIDWDAVHQRLDATNAALSLGVSPSEEKRRSTLKERARALSRESGTAGPAGEIMDLLEFRLSSERYAVECAFVREVLPLKELTPLPGTPSFVVGIANLRGQIVSILDFRSFFGIPAIGLGDLNKFIVVRNDWMEFGILADEVLGVRAIPRAAVQPPIPTLTGIGAEYLIGITDSGMVVLDAEAILGDERIVVCDDA
jgi:purine-binding chemotaxis protein CheW